MLSTLYLLKYNNYYNRILKKHDTLSEYTDFMLGEPLTNINFNPNDGVSTKQIINWNNDIPDYLLVVEGTNTIVSRWFVIESRRLLSGQFEMILFRDCLADYLDEIKQAPMFIEKGYVGIQDSAIFNDEQISVNQIKESEELLKDKTKTSWIVGYCANSKKENADDIRVSYGTQTGYNLYTPTLEDWDYYQYIGKELKFIDSYNYQFNLVYNQNGVKYYTKGYKFTESGLEEVVDLGGDRGTGYVYTHQYTKGVLQEVEEVVKDGITSCIPDNFRSKMLGEFGLLDNTDLFIKLLNLSKSIISVNGVRYGISLGADETDITPYKLFTEENVGCQKDSAYGLAWKTFTGNLNELRKSGAAQVGFISGDGSGKTDSYRTTYTYKSVKLTLVPLTTVSGAEFIFPKERKPLIDAPYCMFCIPYGDMLVAYTEDNSNKFIDVVSENSLAVAAGIANALGSTGVLYDIQLLPYCPIAAIRDNIINGTLDIRKQPFTAWLPNVDYVTLAGASTVLFFCEESSGSFDIPVGNSGYYFSGSLQFKAGMLSKVHRLCSPNYNGVFEFNVFKNKGLQYINVDYTYKPYQPYIHLNPNFGGLYGKDFNDSRGLICGGDFSLPAMTETWKQYQAQNRTYQEQFNRQIENLEIQHKYARIGDQWSMVTGTITGAMTGAMGGSMAGGGYGAAIGASIGGIASGLAGAKDLEIKEALRNEAMDYTKDLFGLQLDNIKALPQSLTKVSAFNANNKIFPFLEIYTCTDVELEAIYNKLKYNGYTVGRIDKLENMINNIPVDLDMGYIKGQLIRLDSINDDFHIVNTIASELNKGVYV